MCLNLKPDIRIIFVILLSVFVLFSCRTKKATLVKKEESVSVLTQNKIQKSESEKIQSDILKIKDLKNLSLSPEDPEKELQVIFRGDTLKAKNANINFSRKQSSEKDNSTAERNKKESDNSLTEIDTKTASKVKDTDVQSASWGINFGFILAAVVGVILLYFHFRNSS